MTKIGHVGSEASADLRRPHNGVLGFHSSIGQVHGSVDIVAVDVGSDPVSQVSAEVSHGLSKREGLLGFEVVHLASLVCAVLMNHLDEFLLCAKEKNFLAQFGYYFISALRPVPNPNGQICLQ